MDSDEKLWKELEKDIDLYKYYLEILVKSAIFVFGITGGIVTYFLSNDSSNPLLKYSLILPIIINSGLFIICFYSIKFAETLQEGCYRVCKKAGVTFSYEMSPLANCLRLFSVMYSLCAIGLIILLLIKFF